MSKWLLVVLAVSALVLFLRSRSFAEGAISATEAATWLKDHKGAQLIDVRSAGEYADGHLADAKLIPVQEIGDRLSEIDKDKPVLLYCRSGHRSGVALKVLLEHGYTDAKHIQGGINAWKSAGLPVTK